MRSPTEFIVKPVDGRRYANSKEIGGVEFYISVSDEDHTSSNRFGEVIALPLYYEGPVSIGDTLLVHHNVFKFYNDMQGNQRSGKSFFKEDMFFIDDLQYYMYHNGTEWNTVGGYSFITPIKMVNEDGKLFLDCKEEPLVGIVKYPSDYMLSKGVEVGDKVLYTPDTEYEFTVEEEKMYRLMDNHITVVL